MSWGLLFELIYKGNFICAYGHIKEKNKVIIFDGIAYMGDREILSLCKSIPYYFPKQSYEIQYMISGNCVYINIGNLKFDIIESEDTVIVVTY